MIAWLVRGCLRKHAYANEAEANAACQRVMHGNRGTNPKGRTGVAFAERFTSGMWGGDDVSSRLRRETPTHEPPSAILLAALRPTARMNQ